MNKLANTYLDAVNSLLKIHLTCPRPDDWHMIVSNLYDAVLALTQDISLKETPHVFRHDWTPEELAQQEKMMADVESELQALDAGPSATTEDDPLLTLDHLKQQVD